MVNVGRVGEEPLGELKLMVVCQQPGPDRLLSFSINSRSYRGALFARMRSTGLAESKATAMCASRHPRVRSVSLGTDLVLSVALRLELHRKRLILRTRRSQPT